VQLVQPPSSTIVPGLQFVGEKLLEAAVDPGVGEFVKGLISRLRHKQEAKQVLDFRITLPDGTTVAVDPPGPERLDHRNEFRWKSAHHHVSIRPGADVAAEQARILGASYARSGRRSQETGLEWQKRACPNRSGIFPAQRVPHLRVSRATNDAGGPSVTASDAEVCADRHL
jgi:hypothetical protein